MNALEEDPIDGDQDGSQFFLEDKKYYGIKFCDVLDK